MNYEEVMKYYNNSDNYRILMMKLSTKYNFEELFNIYIKNTNLIKDKIPTLDILFKQMKGEWDIESGIGNRVYDVKRYNKKHCKNIAVLFTIKVLNNNVLKKNKNRIYNIYNYIQKHPYVFGDKIRYHVCNTIEKN